MERLQMMGLDWLYQKMNKGVSQRRRSILAYIEGLFSRHSRLLVIRLDLGYRKGYFLEREDFFAQDLAKVKRDWEFLYEALNSGLVPEMAGFVVKVEYGILTGFHLHVLLILDGSKSCSDVTIGNIVGSYWNNAVTKGFGRFFNCNRDPERYEKRGIGAINYHEMDLRSNLNKNVVEYLIKSDAVTSWRCPDERVMFRGWTPKALAFPQGRPRSNLL
tara:strand:- start:620 stop:1270 length:651 start_codon:yes stop_codon:yes gene_type:complete